MRNRIAGLILLTVIFVPFGGIKAELPFEIVSISASKVDALAQQAEDVRSFGVEFNRASGGFNISLYEELSGEKIFSKDISGGIAAYYISPGIDGWDGKKLKPSTKYKYVILAKNPDTGELISREDYFETIAFDNLIIKPNLAINAISEYDGKIRLAYFNKGGRVYSEGIKIIARDINGQHLKGEEKVLSVVANKNEYIEPSNLMIIYFDVEPGEYNIEISLDTENKIDESDELNNKKSDKLIIFNKQDVADWYVIPEKYYENIYVNDSDKKMGKRIKSCEDICAENDSIAYPKCIYNTTPSYCSKSLINGSLSLASECIFKDMVREVGTENCCCVIINNNSSELKEPDIKIIDFGISPTTKKINVTIKNNGTALDYQKTLWVLAEDVDTGKRFAKMLVAIGAGKEINLVLDDNWYVNESSSEVETRDIGIYNIKAWIGEATLKKKIDISNTKESSMEIVEFKVDNNFEAGDRLILDYNTNIDSTSTISYRSKTGTEKIIELSEFAKKHRVEIKDLDPFTVYYFVVWVRSGSLSFNTGQQMIATGGSKSLDENGYIKQCQDTSGKKNVFEKGVVSGGLYGGNYWYYGYLHDDLVDRCSGLKEKTEFYCDGNNVVREIIKCENGCVDGVCVENTDTKKEITSLADMVENAKRLQNNKLDEILSELKVFRDAVKEQANKKKYLEKLTKNVEKVSQNAEAALNNFITYGVDDNTKRLGEGERAAVIYSYKAAFNKLPETEEELADVIKIANGRWPSVTKQEAEKKAKGQFEKIYKKIADMNNPRDNAAITVMAYGLKQKAENRNLDSEKQGIKIFKNIYGFNPSTTEDWNSMQAITYSGASRGIDADGDLLTDEREKELGTDPKNSDTDGDGYKDGVEVANGYGPLKK